MQESPQNARLPLVIGVSGHRDLRAKDIEALENQVEHVFDRLRERCPNTDVILLSALAEGADCLVARVASRRNIPLMAALPWPSEQYRERFSEANAVAQFDQLLERSLIALQLSGSAAGGVQPLSDEDRYRTVGAYIVSHCQLLIALWDGDSNVKQGGTSDNVRFRLHGLPLEYRPADTLLDRADTGPVWQIVTLRKTDPDPPHPFKLIERFPSTDPTSIDSTETGPAAVTAATNFDRALSRIDEFNDDTRRHWLQLAPLRREARDDLGVAPNETSGLRSAVDCFANADALARHYQRITRWWLGLLLIAAFGIAASFQLHVRLRAMYGKLPDAERPWIFKELLILQPPDRMWLWIEDLPYLLLLCLAAVGFYWVRRHDYHSKYLDYRALAEAMRVQFFWCLTGLRECVADYYLRKQKGELEWIRGAIRNQELRERSLSPFGHESTSLAIEHWAGRQSNYFTRRASSFGRLSKRYKRLARFFFLLGFGLLVARAFAPPDHLLVIGLSLTLTIALLLSVHAKIAAISEHAKWYAWMARFFTDAHQRLIELSAAGNPDAVRAVFKELGREALAENGDWLLLHRERPLELPRA